MKNIRSFLAIIGLTGLLPLFQSCNDNDDPTQNYQTALVTVCPNEDGSFIMNLDDATVLYPTNLKVSPFGGKEVRALVNYEEVQNVDARSTVKMVQVVRMDSIRTKETIPYMTDQEATYGEDPLEIVQDWVTVAEDGYITLRIRTMWGESTIPHSINLVTGVNADDEYEMELRHNANGDMGDRLGDAIIAFNLNTLPYMAGDVKIKLRWKSFTGEKSADINLKMRKQEADNPQ